MMVSRIDSKFRAGRVALGVMFSAAIVCGMPLQPAPDYGRKEECGVVRADASARRTLSVEQQVERRARREVTAEHGPPSTRARRARWPPAGGQFCPARM